jgi:ANTAR domain/GAF domain
MGAVVPKPVDLSPDAEKDVVRQLDDVTGALEDLSSSLEQDEELSVVLLRVCSQIIHAIPGADVASVTLLGEHGPFTSAVTDDVAHELDAAQYASGHGPCTQAADTGVVVRTTVAEGAERWPVFADVARGSEVASVLSAPLFIDREYQGTINLYGRDEHGYRELDSAVFELYTTAAEAALRADRRYRASRDHASHLGEALTSRAAIDQAKGIIMAARRIDADAAFAVLVERSQRENRKLREVAEEFVAGASRPDCEPDDRPA